MDQEFNLKRFFQYAGFTISRNRWYYGILFVFFTIPAVVLSFCGVVPDVACAMIGFVFMTLNSLPSIEWTRKIGQRMQWDVVSATRTERLVYECIVRFSGFIVPIAICSIGFAFGLGSPDKFFSDVVPMGGMALLLAVAMLFFLIGNFDIRRLIKKGKPLVITNLYLAFSQGFVVGMQPIFFKSIGSSIIFQIICFAIAAIAFVFAVIKYPNLQTKTNEL